MASRAYFRCRACGEPVMAGAYRCPVCGIDFPSGTPGAPDTTSPYEDPPRYAEAFRDDIEDAEFEPEEPERVDVLDFAPGGAARDDEAQDFTAAEPHARAADLNVRPREEARAGAATAPLSVRPAREATVAVPDIDYTTVETEHPRRSWARGLGGTLLSALILLAIVAGSGLWLHTRGALPSSGGKTADAVTVKVTDGWVNLPTEERPLVVEADGPFRLRISGKVYSLRGDRPVQVPAEVDAAVRIVRGPTTATIRPR